MNRQAYLPVTSGNLVRVCVYLLFKLKKLGRGELVYLTAIIGGGNVCVYFLYGINMNVIHG